MDINQNMVEKNGLFIERYSVWERSLKKKSLDKKLSRKKQILIKLGIFEWDEL